MWKKEKKKWIKIKATAFDSQMWEGGAQRET